MSFSELRNKAKEYGLDAIEHTPYHWQVIGGKFLVNYYPGRGTVYVNGMTKGQKRMTIDDAIKAAFGEKMPVVPKQKRRPKSSAKRRMYKKSNICAICKTPMTIEEATVDHVIPLSKGGSNRSDNLQLAHQSCNLRKADEL